MPSALDMRAKELTLTVQGTVGKCYKQFFRQIKEQAPKHTYLHVHWHTWGSLCTLTQKTILQLRVQTF